MRPRYSIGVAALAGSLGLPAGAQQMDILRFSIQEPTAHAPAGWSPISFKKRAKQTQYTLVKHQGRTVLQAHAVDSASGLISRVQAKASDTPVLNWRWRVERLLSGSDIRRKAGDDYPVRVYVTFAFDAGRASWRERLRYKAAQLAYGKELPYSGLCYVWDTRAPVGTIAPNAYAPSVKMIVLESGPAKAGQWVEQTRNIVADYRSAFGVEPPPVTGLAIMTDTDDTHESVTAWYGDITLTSVAADTQVNR